MANLEILSPALGEPAVRNGEGVYKIRIFGAGRVVRSPSGTYLEGDDKVECVGQYNVPVTFNPADGIPPEWDGRRVSVTGSYVITLLPDESPDPPEAV